MAATTKGGVYYGWIMVATGMLSLALTIGTTTNAFGLYVLPVSAEFALSRASMNTGMILMNTGAAVASVIIGRLLDHYPATLIMGVSGGILAASLATLGLSHHVLLSAAVLSFPVGVGIAGIGQLTVTTLIARWFTVHRGRALAITMMGMSLSTISVAPAIAWLIDQVGWRQSLVALGVLVALVATAMLPLIRNGPRPDEHETRDENGNQRTVALVNPDANERQFSAGQLLAMPQFWAIGMSTATVLAIFSAMLISLVPIGRALGWSGAAAATLISVIGTTAIVGKSLVAWIADRFDRSLMLAGLFALMAVGSAVMLFAHGYLMLALCSAIIGFATGATMPLYLTLMADKFGAKSFGTGNGIVMFMIAVTSAFAIRFSGEVYDRTGHYDVMCYSFIVISILSACVVLSLRGQVRYAARPAAAE